MWRNFMARRNIKSDNNGYIRDLNGNVVGVATTLQPSGAKVVYYPPYLKYNAENADANRRRRIKLGLDPDE